MERHYYGFGTDTEKDPAFRAQENNRNRAASDMRMAELARDFPDGVPAQPPHDKWATNPNYVPVMPHIPVRRTVRLVDPFDERGVWLRHEPTEEKGKNSFTTPETEVTTTDVKDGDFVQVQTKGGVNGWVKSKYIHELSKGGSRSRKYKNKISKKRSRAAHKRRRNNRSKTSRNVRRRVR